MESSSSPSYPEIDFREVRKQKQVSDASFHLLEKLYSELSASESDILFSPLGFCTALLALKTASVDEDISKQIQKCMDFPEDEETLYLGYSLALTSLEYLGYLNESSKVHNHTTFFLKKESALKDFYIRFMKDLSIRFERNPNAEELMVLSNSFSFKSTWATPFYRGYTEEMSFFVPNAPDEAVSGMRVLDQFPLVILPEFDAKGILIPFKEERFKMLIVIPDKSFGLEDIELSLCSIKPEEYFQRSELTLTHLQIPKFRIVCNNSLLDFMYKIGIDKIRRPYSLNQKSLIEITEEGLGRGGILLETQPPLDSSHAPVTNFIINCPFFYTIFDLESGFVLLAGKCSNPNKLCNLGLVKSFDQSKSLKVD